MTAKEQLESAFQLRREGMLSESASLASSLLETAEWYRAMELAAVNFLEMRNFTALADVLQAAAARGYQAPLLFSRILDNCLRTDQYALIEEIAQLTPRENPLHVVGVYYVGCVRVVRRDPGAALAVFEYFRSIVSQYLPLIPFDSDPDLNVLYRQGILVAGPAEVQRRLNATDTLPSLVHDFTLIERARPSGLLLCASADARYAERFARGLLASIPPEAGLHLHVVNPLPETLLLLRELAEIAGAGRWGVSTSRDENYATATAYACSRFAVLPHLLRFYDRPIVAVDVDVLVTERLAHFDTSRLDFDFGCFESERREPASLYLAGVMVTTPSPACLDFLDALSRFCLFALKTSLSTNWQLDQAALYSLIHFFSKSRPDLRFRVLNTLGGTVLDYITLVTSDEEKFKMRADANIPARRDY